MKSKYHFICINCHKEYQANEVIYLCPACEADNNTHTPPKGVLKTVYNYNEIAQKLNNFNNLKAENYLSLLPLQSVASMGYLRVGNTPLYKIDAEKDFGLYLKDDSQNPSFSFKDRASILVSAYAKENNIETIVAASTGNAGSSLACICASQQQKAVIFVPAKAPLAKLTQIIMYGARIVPVDGNYDMAFDLSIEAGMHFGWYNRNTAYNPFTIEGKKTVSFEIFDQLQQQIPDRIFVPVGDGVIISGVYKGFEDLLKLGFIEKMPIIIAVQSEQSKNLTANIHSDNWQTFPSNTLADSISVDIPRNFYMAKDFLQKYHGEILTVSDESIIQASVQLSKQTGIFAEPAAATAFAGYLNFRNQNLLKTGSKNVVLLTGSGLKDLKSLSPVINMPQAIKADISSVIDYLNN